VRIDVVTIFPDYLTPLELSLVGKARRAGVLDLRVHDLRRWATDRHRTVDDTPYGGGAGMVMRPDVWGRAFDTIAPPDAEPPRLVVPTPSGRVFDQALATELGREPWLLVACGRYEGIDARVVADAAGRMPVTELSIGDYVLTGGEAAALVVIEAITRLLPGVLGNPESLLEESHGAAGLLEYPVYTKPPTWRGHDVPDVLLSGHHARVTRWRRDQALRRTAERRPDLIERLDPALLDAHDREVLAGVGWLVSDDAVRQAPDSAG
jgi:tRNA (guanine37-N1)-methyltransferase